MIIGNGMIASAFREFKDNDNVLIFASGVSNSQETNKNAFQREQKLIEDTIQNYGQKLFVYFSTCSMYDPDAQDTLYVQHKLHMEKLIQEKSNTFLILRISQILGKSKNNTLVNYLYNRIYNNKHFELWKNSNRNLIALPEVLNISRILIENKKNHNSTFHIANPIYIYVTELVHMFEEILRKQAHYTIIEKGSKYNPIPLDITNITQSLQIEFDQKYYFKHLKHFCHEQSKQ